MSKSPVDDQDLAISSSSSAASVISGDQVLVSSSSSSEDKSERDDRGLIDSLFSLSHRGDEELFFDVQELFESLKQRMIDSWNDWSPEFVDFFQSLEQSLPALENCHGSIFENCVSDTTPMGSKRFVAVAKVENGDVCGVELIVASERLKQIYVGELRLNERGSYEKNGNGMLASANDARRFLYEGSFRGNKSNGDGEIRDSAGLAYKGNWEDGKQHGKNLLVDGEFWRDGRKVIDRPPLYPKGVALTQVFNSTQVSR